MGIENSIFNRRFTRRELLAAVGFASLVAGCKVQEVGPDAFSNNELWGMVRTWGYVQQVGIHKGDIKNFWGVPGPGQEPYWVYAVYDKPSKTGSPYFFVVDPTPINGRPALATFTKITVTGQIRRGPLVLEGQTGESSSVTFIPAEILEMLESGN